jgi:hypothetical protein
VKRARLAKITVNGQRSEVLAVRGIEPEKRDFIRLDLEVRDRLGVKLDEMSLRSPPPPPLSRCPERAAPLSLICGGPHG